MDASVLRHHIESAGFGYVEANAYPGLLDDTGGLGRIICTENNKARFWLHNAPDGTWYLGLFSGPMFRLADSSQLVTMTVDLLSRRSWPTRMDEYDQEMLDKYGLEIIDDLD